MLCVEVDMDEYTTGKVYVKDVRLFQKRKRTLGKYL
jgi:hypothetical protein